MVSQQTRPLLLSLACQLFARINFLFHYIPPSKEHYHNKAELLGAAHGFRDRKIPVDMIVQGQRGGNSHMLAELSTRVSHPAAISLSSFLHKTGSTGAQKAGVRIGIRPSTPTPGRWSTSCTASITRLWCGATPLCLLTPSPTFVFFFAPTPKARFSLFATFI